jgi:hypothetical protein
MGKKRNAYRLLVGKPEGKRTLGRPRRRWVDNIKMDLGEIGMRRCGLDWSGSGEGEVGCSCKCGNETSGSIKCCEVLSGCTTGGLSSSDQLSRVSYNKRQSDPIMARVVQFFGRTRLCWSTRYI